MPRVTYGQVVGIQEGLSKISESGSRDRALTLTVARLLVEIEVAVKERELAEAQLIKGHAKYDEAGQFVSGPDGKGVMLENPVAFQVKMTDLENQGVELKSGSIALSDLDKLTKYPSAAVIAQLWPVLKDTDEK